MHPHFSSVSVFYFLDLFGFQMLKDITKESVFEFMRQHSPS